MSTYSRYRYTKDGKLKKVKWRGTDTENAPVVMEFTDGWQAAWLRTSKALADENRDVGHNMGAEFPEGHDFLNNGIAYFSLRKDNFVEVTVAIHERDCELFIEMSPEEEELTGDVTHYLSELISYAIPAVLLRVQPGDEIPDGEHVTKNGVLIRVEDGVLHSEAHPAIVWPDGTEEWSLNGWLYHFPEEHHEALSKSFGPRH